MNDDICVSIVQPWTTIHPYELAKDGDCPKLTRKILEAMEYRQFGVTRMRATPLDFFWMTGEEEKPSGCAGRWDRLFLMDIQDREQQLAAIWVRRDVLGLQGIDYVLAVLASRFQEADPITFEFVSGLAAFHAARWKRLRALDKDKPDV